jgi:translation initiation factor IF-1
MAKEAAMQFQGKVTQALANAHFRVKLDNNDHEIICHVAGKMRLHYIRIIPGDEVTVEMSTYDMTKGRITYRGKPRKSSDEEAPPTAKKAG